jgi:adenylate cyclase
VTFTKDIRLLNESDLSLVRELLARELATVNHYAQLLNVARTPVLKAFLQRVISEEKEHIAEAAAVLGISSAVSRESAAPAVRSQSTVLVQPLNRQLSAPEGRTLLATILDADIPIQHVCGGKGQCGTCRVEVISGSENLSSITKPEINLLGDLLDQSWRLACQSKPAGPVTVRVPPVPTDEQ